MDIGPAAGDANAASACFRECCTSSSVPLATPKSAFATGLTKIHDGPASAVFLGRFNGAPVAVKRPKLPTKAEIDRYHVELRLMLELTHDHILPLLAAHARPPEYYLVFPYQENGSVASLVHDQGWRPSWPAVLVLLQQVASALAFVHARGYVHRDVKPSNVLLDARWKATLCDFGLAESEETLRASLQNVVYSEEDAEGRTVAGRLIATLGVGGKDVGGPSSNRERNPSPSTGGKPSGGFQKQHMVGTLPYMPPEVLMRRVPGFAADAYAFGVSACEVATGIAPYSDRERNVALAHTIMDLSYNESDLAVAIASENLRPSLPSETLREDTASKSAWVAAEGVSRLASACWALDAQTRPSLERVLAELERVVDAYKRAAGLDAAAPLEPRWSPPTAAARDAGEAAREAESGLFADRAWPAPRDGIGAAPALWPKLALFDASSDSNDRKGDSDVFRAGVFSACGARGPDKMEDRHLLVSDVGGVRGAHLACVFDGHRGFECAEFCRRNFEKALVSVWHECATPEEALTRAFAALDEAFVDAFERTKVFSETSKEKERFPGCTAIVAMRWGERVYVANAGDCRAVVCREPGLGNEEKKKKPVGRAERGPLRRRQRVGARARLRCCRSGSAQARERRLARRAGWARRDARPRRRRLQTFRRRRDPRGRLVRRRRGRFRARLGVRRRVGRRLVRRRARPRVGHGEGTVDECQAARVRGARARIERQRHRGGRVFETDDHRGDGHLGTRVLSRLSTRVSRR